MKKSFIWLVILALSLCSISAVAFSQGTEVPSQDETIQQTEMLDIQNMSIDELLSLQNEIQRVLADKGYVQYEELDRGSKGDAVLDVQIRLKELGYYTGNISGKYDSETQKAFKLFEKNNNLTNDGKASQSDLIVLFGSTAIAKATPTPQSEKVSTTKKPEIALEGYLPFSDFDYTEYSRYPEKYNGTKIILKGKAIQVIGSRTRGYNIRLATAGNSDVVYIRVNTDPGYNILENDRLTVYATMKDPYTYTSTFFVSVTIPSADADGIQLN